MTTLTVYVIVLVALILVAKVKIVFVKRNTLSVNFYGNWWIEMNENHLFDKPPFGGICPSCSGDVEFYDTL